MHIMTSQLTEPLLFLTSENAGWDDLIVRAFHEPDELTGWIEPVIPDTSLVLMTRGVMLMEQRLRDGTWRGAPFREGFFSLRPGGTASSELRWRTLSNEPMQTLHINLKHHLLARTAEEVAERDPSRLTLTSRGLFRDPLLAQIGLALWRELEQPTFGGKIYAQTAAQMLAVHLLRHYASTNVLIKSPPKGLNRQQMNAVTEFIRAHLSDNLSLEQLAQQAGFSAYHFARLFRQTTGQSPHQFVLLQRIERAQILLKRTDMPLTQVALESGFANQSHLAKVFKQQCGVTPTAYRLGE